MENFRVQLEFSRIYYLQVPRKFIFRSKFLLLSVIHFSWPLEVSLIAEFLSVTYRKADMIIAVGTVIIKGHDKTESLPGEGLQCMGKRKFMTN